MRQNQTWLENNWWDYIQINDSEAAKCVPDSLYLLLKWLFSDDDTFIDDDAVHVPSHDDGDSDNGNRKTVATQLNQEIINTDETIFVHTQTTAENTPRKKLVVEMMVF